ncbi:hypothetical protein RCO48_12590 [Peribacillus frigoritolerans]|nr:hypothetical protein [Peribacillus frigoritolerans]
MNRGAGRIQVDEALKADTLLNPSSLSFGMYTKKEGIEEHHETVVIENTGTEMRKYSFMVPLKETGLTWELPKSLTLKPKEKETDKSRIAGQPSRT